MNMDSLYCGIRYVGVCRGQIYAIQIDSSQTTGETSTVSTVKRENQPEHDDDKLS